MSTESARKAGAADARRGYGPTNMSTASAVVRNAYNNSYSTTKKG